MDEIRAMRAYWNILEYGIILNKPDIINLCKRGNLPHLNSKGYPKMHVKGSASILLSRFVLNARPGELVDHKNGNPLDNRRRNLRIVTHQQNMWNSKIPKNNNSGVKGVSRFLTRVEYTSKKTGLIKYYIRDQWSAEIIYNGRRRRKRFDRFGDAVKWRKSIERKLFGNYVRK